MDQGGAIGEGMAMVFHCLERALEQRQLFDVVVNGSDSHIQIFVTRQGVQPAAIVLSYYQLIHFA
jgi:hypothetical protein